jgi:hypothetical protein
MTNAQVYIKTARLRILSLSSMYKLLLICSLCFLSCTKNNQEIEIQRTKEILKVVFPESGDRSMITCISEIPYLEYLSNINNFESFLKKELNMSQILNI